MLSGKSNDPTVIVAFACPADAGGEPRLPGPVQAAHSTASARHAAERTFCCLGILTPCLGIPPSCASRCAQASTGLAGSTAARLILSLRQANICRAPHRGGEPGGGPLVRPVPAGPDRRGGGPGHRDRRARRREGAGGD